MQESQILSAKIELYNSCTHSTSPRRQLRQPSLRWVYLCFASANVGARLGLLTLPAPVTARYLEDTHGVPGSINVATLLDHEDSCQSLHKLILSILPAGCRGCQGHEHQAQSAAELALLLILSTVHSVHIFRTQVDWPVA